MIIFRRIIPWTATLLLAAAFEVMVFVPEAWYIVLTAIVIVVFFSSFLLNNQRKFSSVVAFLIGPLFLNLGAFLILLVLQNSALSQALVAITVLGTLLFFEQLFTFHFLPDRYKPHALEHISFPVNMLAVYFLGTGFAALWVLMSVSPLYLTPGFFLICLLLSWQYFWASKVPMRKARWAVLCSAALVAQLFWVMAYLPLSFYVVGILLVAVYYLVLNLTRFSTLDSLGSNVVKRTVLLVAIVVISVLVTAKWM